MPNAIYVTTSHRVKDQPDMPDSRYFIFGDCAGRRDDIAVVNKRNLWRARVPSSAPSP